MAAGGPMRPNSGRIPILQMEPLLRLIGRPAQRGCDRPRLPPGADIGCARIKPEDRRRERKPLRAAAKRSLAAV